MIPVINRFNDKHQQLLGLIEGDSTREVLDEVFNFLEELVQAGTDVTDARQRSHLRGLIRFWSSYVYDRTGEFHQVQLLPSTGVSKTKEEELSVYVVPSTDGESYESSSMAKDSNNGHGKVIEKLKDLPATIGPYEVFEEIGEGGFSTVYMARDTRQSKMVALKVLKDRLFLTSTDFRRSLVKREKETISYSHPNIIPVYEVAEYDGLACTAMKWVEDGSLADFMTGSYWRPTIGKILHIIGQAVDGLTYLHSLGIVHGDIKPANLLLTVDHHVYLTDFGITQLIESAFQGIRVGTPEYMAPESILHPDAIDGRADIYGLGIVLFQLLMGRPPFTAQSEQEVIYHQVNRPVPDMGDVPDALADVVRKCLAKNPDERYANTEEFQADINLLLDSLPPGILGTAPLYFTTPPHNRYQPHDTTTLRRPTGMAVVAPLPPPPLPAINPSREMPSTGSLDRIFCDYCGSENAGMATFCKNCGTILRSPARSEHTPSMSPMLSGQSSTDLLETKLVFGSRDFAPDEPLAILIYRSGIPRNVDHIIIRKKRSIVGRLLDHEIALMEESVSRHHALLMYEKSGSKKANFTLYDFASTNGTFVNTKRVQYRRRINHNDTIQFGQVKLIFKRLDDDPDRTWSTDADVLVERTEPVAIYQPHELEPDTVLSGRYRVIRLTERGGTDLTYLVEDLSIGITRAIVHPDVYDIEYAEQQLSLFETQAKMLLSLSHPNIVQAIDLFHERDIPFLVLEHFPGQTSLEDLLVFGRTFTESEVRDWAAKLCEALTYLHTQSRPIIHRDVKPGNILLADTGQIKLSGFELARFYKAGKKSDTHNLGTPAYAAPEQYANEQTDARTDIYGLGATMYNLLSKQDPPSVVQGEEATPVHVLNPSISIELSAVVEKAMEKDRALRFQSAEEMKQALLELDLT